VAGTPLRSIPSRAEQAIGGLTKRASVLETGISAAGGTRQRIAAARQPVSEVHGPEDDHGSALLVVLSPRR